MIYLQLLLIFLLFFLPPIDTDLGWHLRYGEYFLKTGNWLRENEFTYFLADYAWVNPFVLYEIFVAAVYKLGGLVGLSLAYAGVMTAAFWFYSRVAPKLPFTNLLTFVAITGASWHVFSLGMRAQIFSLLGTIILFLVIHKIHKIHLPLLLLLFLVWANTHGGFVLGLGLLGLAAFDGIIKKNWKSTFFFGLAAALSSLAAFGNPYGADIYKEALRHVQYPLGQLIAEWVPPSFEIKVFITAILLAAVFLVANSPNRQKFFWIAAGILFVILTFKARRFMPYLGLASALGIITSHEKLLSKIEKNVQKSAVSLLTAGVLILFLWIVPRTLNIDTNWREYCNANKVKQPCRAVEFIRANPIQGQNVFAAYEWGGFLEWQLPQYKYFIDGRMPAWPVSPKRGEGGETPDNKSPYTFYLEIIQARPGYQERLDKYGTDWLLIGAGTFLDIELRTRLPAGTAKDLRQRWKEIYRDNTAVIYTNNLENTASR